MSALPVSWLRSALLRAIACPRRSPSAWNMVSERPSVARAAAESPRLAWTFASS